MGDSIVPNVSRLGAEQTRLLSTSNASYNTNQEETVITISSTRNETSNGHAKKPSNTQAQRAISSGQPTVPIHKLTDKIQDILIFGEIKKKQQERVSQQENNSTITRSVEVDLNSDDEEGDNHSLKQTLKKKLSEWSIDEEFGGNKLRKRDLAVSALKFATDKWKEEHGLPSHADTDVHDLGISETTTYKNKNSNGFSTTAVIHEQQQKKLSGGNENSRSKPILSSADSVFEVAKNASVCAVLALLHEHRRSSGHSSETDVSLQALALSAMSLGLKAHDTSVSHVILGEMLTNKWVDNKSALDWAVENNSELILNDERVQLVIQNLWESGPEWRQEPTHPSFVWLLDSYNEGRSPPLVPSHSSFIWYTFTHGLADYLARWPSPRYQLLTQIITFVIYLGFHLSTVANLDYTSDTPYLYEYFYYSMVISDFLIEYYRLLSRPSSYLHKIASYITLTTVSLLAASCVIRFFALLAVNELEHQIYLLSTSFSLLVLATPLMFFRLFATSSDICWNTSKASYILGQCFINSTWVFMLGAVTLFGFWIALATLQLNDANPIQVLTLLVLGALHAPEIGDTLMYQPEIAALLLAAYLFFAVVVLGSLLTASFLSTILEVNTRLVFVKCRWAVDRCLRTDSVLSVFIPSLFVDLFFGAINWVIRVVFKKQEAVLWLEKTHQVLWYIVYSPIILLVGLAEFVYTLVFHWSLVKRVFSRAPISI